MLHMKKQIRLSLFYPITDNFHASFLYNHPGGFLHCENKIRVHFLLANLLSFGHYFLPMQITFLFECLPVPLMHIYIYIYIFFFLLPAARVQVGCRELRSTKYISDGQCTSISPLKELVCAGECLPLPVLPNWIGGGYGTKYWSRRSSQEWRCVNDKTRTQRIQLQCQDGSTRTYKITVVTACKCKRYTRQHNESSHNFESLSPAKPAQHQRERKRAGKPSKHSMS